jgi:thiol-disulfide isomerase/thioredoxin
MLWRSAVVLGVLLLSAAGGLVWQRRRGRFRVTGGPARQPVMTAEPSASPGGPPGGPGDPAAATARLTGDRLTGDRLGAALGARATLLQFSSAFCAPCRATRALLADVAGIVPGVEHIEVDAESHLDLVRELGVLSTPTVFVLAADGTVVSRASGLPKRPLVFAALAQAMPDSGPDKADATA